MLALWPELVIYRESNNQGEEKIIFFQTNEVLICACFFWRKLGLWAIRRMNPLPFAVISVWQNWSYRENVTTQDIVIKAVGYWNLDARIWYFYALQSTQYQGYFYYFFIFYKGYDNDALCEAAEGCPPSLAQIDTSIDEVKRLNSFTNSVSILWKETRTQEPLPFCNSRHSSPFPLSLPFVKAEPIYLEDYPSKFMRWWFIFITTFPHIKKYQK